MFGSSGLSARLTADKFGIFGLFCLSGVFGRPPSVSLQALADGHNVLE
jgi:hypothetical protein